MTSVFTSFQEEFQNRGDFLPALPDCNRLNYGLVNSNMLLQDIYAPEKFCETPKPLQADEEEDDEEASALDDSEDETKKELRNSMTDIVLS